MIYKIIYICAFIIATSVAAIQNSNSNDKEINYRLPNHTKPIFYDLKLNPYLTIDNFTFEGEIFIHIEILSKTKTLMLHMNKLIIDEDSTFLKSNNGLDFYVPITYSHNNLTELLSLDFDEELSIGRYILYLKFAGLLNDRPYGFYRSSYVSDTGNTVWFAGTYFMATYARVAFPCWDEPALKASFKIAIKHHRNYTAISNMPISEESEVDETDGKMWTHFKESPRISTYLVSFLIFDLRNISNSDGTINVWSRGNVISSASFAHEIAQKAAIELERYTNSSVRLAKVDHVALPDISNKAMESWGLITYKEHTILNNGDTSRPDAFYVITNNIILQSSHQWFGNAISPSWWSDIWINGGLAEYLKYYIADKIYEDRRFVNFLIAKTLDLLLVIDSYDHVKSLNWQPNTTKEINSKIISSLDNRKAFLLLRMLSHYLSDDVFHAGLIRYLNKHKYNVAKPEDLWNALQDASDESGILRNEFTIQEVLDSWAGQRGYPLVTVTRDEIPGKIKITQEYFEPNEKMLFKNSNSTDTANKKWWVPINFATRTNPNFSSTSVTHWLSPEAEELIIDDIDPQDWIIINIQQIGFYRVNYDTMNWLKIADYLNSENYTKIHVLNRAQIINNAIYLMLEDKLDPRIFMNIMKYLRRETDYTVWSSVFKVLQAATNIFTYNGGGELLKMYVLDLMNNIIRTIGIQSRPNDDYFTKMTRYEMLHHVCGFDHPTCLHEAHTQLIAYLENSTFAKRISFYEKKWIFCNGVKLANETIWNKVLYMYTNKIESTLYCLGYSKNLTIIEKYLNMTISDDSPIAKNDVFRVIYSVLSADFPNVDMMMDFIVNHWNKLTIIFDHPIELLNDITWNIISRKQIQKIKALLSKLGMEVPQIITMREQNIEKMETIVNKIHVWLEKNKSLNLSTNITSR
ncbi:membrane alanyl aminopeptidase-like [Pogonomyrmex barbatus]|uniref:Aminopeptidase n=1 Tax=Pogonomyrmex barbatus TaxID=144034 RepID=A0A6I9WJ59_9HYME|nr:membrane alanyl aminopeptidase-like [Pogonomyrmex barbatus]